ncbi:MAG: hypothetical protein Q8K58_05885 [Acidimicrobiales bacterium]|nr:hypothetical protein [Acidimicrobiales bacterium]
MTHHLDPPDDLDPLDALASAHVDGVTTAAEAEQIAASPELQARVRRLRSARDAIREPGPIDVARREEAIGAALAAFDAGEVQTGVVSSLAGREARPDRSRRRRVLGVAAAVAVAALLVPTLSQLGDDEPERPTALSDADDAAEDRAAGAAPDRDASGSGGAAETEMAAPMLEDGPTSGEAAAGAAPAAVHLGSFPDLDALAQSLEGQLLSVPLPERAAATAEGEDDEDDDRAVRRCLSGRLGETAAPDVVVLIGTARLDGRALVVRVVDAPTPGGTARTLTLADPGEGCREVANRVLAS